VNFQGEEAFGYSVQDIWTALHDVKILTKAIPGCKSMTPVGENRYKVALSLGVAAVRGDYEGDVKVTDDRPLVHYVIEGSGKGVPGFVQLRMDCTFERRDAGTLLKWQCEAMVGGLIASVGGKVLVGVSKYMAQQFFRSFRNELSQVATPTCEESVVRLAAVSAAGSGAVEVPISQSEGWFARFWHAILRRFRG
jgi:carbon monoxide dehydrogenase subunit G